MYQIQNGISICFEAKTQTEKCSIESPPKTQAKMFVALGPCRGDSGGPLLSLDSNFRSVLRGIVSFGDTKCDGEIPGIYTRVSRYVRWIRSVIDSHDRG